MPSPDSPQILFHYTTASGLLGIISTRKLWATHARFLNDATELQYGITLIRFILSDYPAHRLPTVRRYNHSAEGPNAFPGWHVPRPLLDDVRPLFFITCFCEVDDLLSQWRGYSPSETGYSLGFHSYALVEDSFRQELFRVIYDPREQESAVRSVIQRSLETDRESSKGEWLEDKLIQLAICLKHPSFAEEREWRLILHLDLAGDRRRQLRPESLGIRYRSAGRFVVPYVERSPQTMDGRWEEPILHLASVRHGPTSSPDEAREGLEWLLWSHGYGTDRTAILGSDTRLRP